MLLLLLSGCSTRLAYNNLDWLAVRWIDRQVDLEQDQRARLRELLEQQLQWHCASQLDDYQSWVEQLRLDLLSGRLDQQRLLAHGESLADFARALADGLEPVLIELAVSLDDRQVEQVLAALDERIEKLQDEIATRSEAQWASDRIEGLERRLRRLMGALNPAQRKRLEQWAVDLNPTHAYQLAQRLYWRERIAETLSRRQDQALVEQVVSALLRPDSAWPEPYRRAVEGNRALTVVALEEVVAMTDAAQRGKISARLSRLKNDFERLSCRGDAPPALVESAAESTIDRTPAATSAAVRSR
ncbi:MAG: DUF6279 family lipoprotein [Wenzhouxiangella sp.]